jgi:hypothetical protein
MVKQKKKNLGLTTWDDKKIKFMIDKSRRELTKKSWVDKV